MEILSEKRRGRRSKLDTCPVYRHELVRLWPTHSAKELGMLFSRSERTIERDIEKLRRGQPTEKAEPLTRASAKTQPGDTKIGPSRSYPAHDIPNGGK